MGEAQGKLNVHKEGNVIVAQIEERTILDEAVARSITDQLATYAYQDVNPRMLLDFHTVEQVSSAGLSMLISIDRLYKQRHGKFILTNVPGRVLEILRVARFDEMFNIQNDPDEAMKQISE